MSAMTKEEEEALWKQLMEEWGAFDLCPKEEQLEFPFMKDLDQNNEYVRIIK